MNTPASDYGQNTWLVEEMYQQYQKDPNSVDPSWREVLKDYRPSPNGEPAAAPLTSQQPNAVTLDEEPAKPAPAPKAPVTEAPATKAASGAGTTARDGSGGDTIPAPAPTAPAPAPVAEPAPTETSKVLRGASAAVVRNMSASLTVPTATSVRAVPVKAMIDNRIVVNNHLARTRGGKVSFTHILGFALVQALKSFPNMNSHFAEIDGKPNVVSPAHTNLGLAIDLPGRDGSRSLVVAAIKECEDKNFYEFWTAYEEVIRRAREGALTAEDFAGVTISLTNPGTIGTVHSVPRLMPGQGAIIGAGAMEYPAEFQGSSDEQIAELGVGKLLTLTSTYDHRIIQGAESGDYLRKVHHLLLDDEFWNSVFTALHIPYEPIRWRQDVPPGLVDKSTRVLELIAAYRSRGHLMADIDPLMMDSDARRSHPDLRIETYGLTLWDLDRSFRVGGFHGKERMRLRDVLSILRDAYCRHVGVEYTHILEPDQQRWLQERVEIKHVKPPVAEQKYIVSKLNAAEAFETFLATKYVGQKRFSLEGAESVIPMMDAVIDQSAEHDLTEVIIGMPHRGRLNVLANIVGKPYSKIFTEFEGNQDPAQAHGSGDVKYHLGTEGTFTAEGGKTTKVYLAANPSHLEAVNPVLEGIVRAKQDRLNLAGEDFTVLPVLMHGDAAFAGQGVVAETLNLSQLRGYRTGGTVHIVVNNQVGFTTAPESSRSSVYATDVARMVQAPIFHVNGDDPEAVVRVARLAFEFRQEFNKDVVVDMVCYRRRGHNEADDPSLTQPLMYNLIDAKRSTRKLYTEALIGRGDISVEEAEAALRDYQEQLERVFTETRDAMAHPTEMSHPVPAPFPAVVTTAISDETVDRIVATQVEMPEGFTVHPRLAPQLQRRAHSVQDGTVDWATGEMLAFGSLLIEGRSVRLAGQDSRRGTFGQRHAVIVDRVTGEEHTPLKYLADRENRQFFFVYDSLLSEYAAMGFEYGYSVARPEVLVLWEAQFGDFADGAQTIIDEFISSGEQKWGQLSGVTLLLPHGYEGQGPDHSSARIERYLQMSAQDNMTVASPTTPASYFHLLRWQAIAPHHKPLVVFTPKSMLRLKAAGSAKEDFTSGTFRPVIGDDTVDPAGVRRVLICTGKVTYDLLAEREKSGRTDVAVVRIERLAPLPVEELTAALAPFPRDAELVYVQEEPSNQGAWPFVVLNLPTVDGRALRRVSRPAAATTAVGTHKVHEREQAGLVAQAFA